MARRHLIVDGANVVHALPGLATLARRDRVSARERLTVMLRTIRDVEDFKVTAVFDGRGTELSVREDPGDPDFTVIVTSSAVTADDVIERLVGKAAVPSDCVVATADRLVRQTVEATGATTLMPDELGAWVERAEQRSRRRITRMRGHSLEKRDSGIGIPRTPKISHPRDTT